MNMRSSTLLLGAALLVAATVSGCSMKPQAPEGALTAAELLSDPVYETQIQVFGQVSQLGELRCPCFALTSEGETIFVWYDLMFDDNEVQRPPVDVEGVENGDWVVVTGELRSTGDSASDNVFWATGIEVVD